MNAPITEAHIELLVSAKRSLNYEEGAQLIADSEAKACAELRVDRDQLRAERNNLRADLDAIKAILTEEKARAERAEAEVERLSDIINRSSVQFFHDGTDGETAAKMLTVLNEAKP
jgi:hypothetical protein